MQAILHGYATELQTNSQALSRDASAAASTRPEQMGNFASARAGKVSGAARHRPARRPSPPRRRGLRWPRPRSACGRRRGTAAPAPATCGPRRSAGRCTRRTAGRPRAARPRPSRTASTTLCAATSSPTIRATSWNTAGNGDTAGAGSVSVIGMASRFSSTAQVPLGRPDRSTTAGCSWPACPTTVSPTSTSAHRPGCHGRCCAARSVSSTPAARPMTRTASNASAACDGPAGTPRARAVRAARPAPRRRAAADVAATRRASRSLRRWAAGRSECVRRRGCPSVGSTTWAIANSADIDGTAGDVAPQCFQQSRQQRGGQLRAVGLQRVEHAGWSTGAGRRRQTPQVEHPGGQERRRQDLDVAVERQRLSDRTAALLHRGEAAACRRLRQHRRDDLQALQPQHLFDEVGGLHEGRAASSAASRSPDRRRRRPSAPIWVSRLLRGAFGVVDAGGAVGQVDRPC